jgi:mannose-6-phosphate isomerase-like protein (cupin superfamily)
VADYTHVNLKEDVEDSAQKHGLAPNIEAHFATQDLELEKSGVSYQRLAPGFRLPFGHRHEQQEEIYVIVSGGGRMKLEDEIVAVKAWDAIRVPPGTTRGVEAGPDGLELLAFGAPNTGEPGADADPQPGWWSD